MGRRGRIPKEEVAKIVDDILAGKRKQVDVARELNVSRQAINTWVRMRVKPERFPEQEPQGPPPKLSDVQERLVCHSVLRYQPSKYKLQVEGDVWIPVAIRDFIQRRFELEVPMATVQNLIEDHDLPVEVLAMPVEGYRKRGRPRKKPLPEEEVMPPMPQRVAAPRTQAKPKLKRKTVKKAEPGPVEKTPIDLDDEPATCDLDFYKNAIKESQEKMAASGQSVGQSFRAGVRTGKHAKGGKRKKKRRK
ncbi:MAG: hypothetical protein ACPGVU_08195 [Limisphaerales bacterium]